MRGYMPFPPIIPAARFLKKSRWIAILSPCQPDPAVCGAGNSAGEIEGERDSRFHRFLEKVDKAERAVGWGYPAEGSAALIMTGSMGFGNTKAITEELLRCAPQMPRW